MKCRQLGALGVIPKPYDPDTLAKTLLGMWDSFVSGGDNR